MPEKTKNYYPWFFYAIIALSYFSLITPLIVSSNFYFPFVGPKSVYFLFISQLTIFFYLILVSQDKSYLPKKNLLLIAFLIYLFSMTLSTIFGVDPSRSFWSKFERMTGLLTWICLFGFLMALSSIKEKIHWKKIFFVSLIIATFIATAGIFEHLGFAAFKISDREGFTLGNTSFLGTYLLFNIFFALYLFFQKENIFSFLKNKIGKIILKIFLVISIFLQLLVIYLQSARAALVSTLGGFLLIFLLWLSFLPQKKGIKILGRILLVSYILICLTGLILIFIPGTILNKEFTKLASASRIITAEISLKAFKEKPILGWGPENFELAFNKYFDPRLFLPEYGGEIWFDRAHNIVFDNLVAGGIFGLVSYLFLFFSAVFYLFKSYLDKKTDFWTFAIFSACLLAYFVQNITVFDMISSLLMFVITLGFIISIASQEQERKIFVFKLNYKNLLLFLIFPLIFYKFAYQPFASDMLIIEAIKRENPEERVALYKKTLSMSPVGKYQNREFFASISLSYIEENYQNYSLEDIKEELDFLLAELKKSEEESPLDLRNLLKLSSLLDTYAMLGSSKLALARDYGKKIIERFPNNPQSYWSLAQTEIISQNYQEALNLTKKAIEIEPRIFQSHEIALKVANLAQNKEAIQELYNDALSINPNWESSLKKYLSQ
jgi:O-antigen ligase